MKRISTLFLIIYLLSCGMSKAQDAPDATMTASSYCFSVEEIEQMLHLSFRNAYDILDSKGYQMGFYSDKFSDDHRDTIDGIVLTYSRMTFNDANDRNSALWLYTSQDGLSNIVEWERNRPGGCTLFPLFHQRGYVYDRASGIFRGSGVYNGMMENYEVQYYEDSTVLRLTMKNIREIDTYVALKREAREAELLAQVEEARMLTAADRYLPALALLDSLVGFGARVDSTIANTRRVVLDQAESYYTAMLETLVSNNNDLQEAIKYCDTLLLITQAQDSIREMRSVLQKQFSGEISRYSDVRPEEYREVVSRLEQLVNEELKYNVNQEERRMKLSFTISTRKENESSGKVSMGLTNGVMKTPAAGGAGMRLQRKIDELAQSDLISPVRQHGVYVTTRDQLTADISWQHYEMKVQDQCNSTNQHLAEAVRYVDDKFFTDNNRVRKPTKRIYTFSVNEKRMGERLYTDIMLTKFGTTGLLSWTPSLLIPGLGTRNQGLYSTASARAVPFFLFSAMAITGFWWENNWNKYTDSRPPLSEGGAMRPWYYENMGYYLGFGAGAISATIYVNELVEGISCSIRNLNRSKELRKKLKNGPIEIQNEMIRLQ